VDVSVFKGRSVALELLDPVSAPTYDDLPDFPQSIPVAVVQRRKRGPNKPKPASNTSIPLATVEASAVVPQVSASPMFRRR